MQGLQALIWTGVLVIGLPLISQGADYYRCLDDQGQVSFSDQRCPNGERLRLEPANSLPAPSIQYQAAGRVSGQQRTLPCGGLLDPRERRTAQIRREVRAGMSRGEIESALGKPEKISHRNGQTRYQYRDEQGGLRTVRFDEQGCVKSGS
ncbi:MAG TPA: DUF4124 domain-containing protein [Pseudomonas sp.]|jgi:hypothetical protein|nr:DUF4124 domain-containing protein [Pseudomonas sp.]